MNRPDVTALARQLARQQAVIAERDAEIAELKQMIDALGETIDLLLDDSEERAAEIARLQAENDKLQKAGSTIMDIAVGWGSKYKEVLTWGVIPDDIKRHIEQGVDHATE